MGILVYTVTITNIYLSGRNKDLFPLRKNVSCDETGRDVMNRLGDGRHTVHCPYDCPIVYGAEVCSNDNALVSPDSSLCATAQFSAEKHMWLAKVQLEERVGLDFSIEAETSAASTMFTCQKWNEVNYFRDLVASQKEFADALRVDSAELRSWFDKHRFSIATKIVNSAHSASEIPGGKVPKAEGSAPGGEEEQDEEARFMKISGKEYDDFMKDCKWEVSNHGQWEYFDCVFEVTAQKADRTLMSEMSYASTPYVRKGAHEAPPIQFPSMGPVFDAKEEVLAPATCPAEICKSEIDCWIDACAACEVCAAAGKPPRRPEEPAVATTSTTTTTTTTSSDSTTTTTTTTTPTITTTTTTTTTTSSAKAQAVLGSWSVALLVLAAIESRFV